MKMELQTIIYVFILNILLKCVTSEEWTHHTVLDGNGKYNLYWKPPEDRKANSEIIFQAEVEAKGFIGFGLSPNGGMTGSDIVTGWVKDGEVYFQDRHGIGKKLPPKDEKQDWTLLDAKENDTHTILKFSRKLDTCDEDDMVIDDSTMRLIYSYSEEDPKAENPFYHGMNRGTKSALLLQIQTKNEPTKDESSLPYWDIQSPNVDISYNRTLYWCKIFKSPDLDKKHHIVHVKPLIQEGHEEFVHHMLLYECVGGTDDEYSELLDFVGHECHHPNMPEPMQKCEGVSVGWAVGGNDLVFPEHVGMPLEQVPGKYYMLEVHYDNPMRRKGIIDNSGLRIYYTPELRKYDAGCLMVGSAVSPRLLVPPGQENYVVAGHSNPECLDSAMPEEGLKGLGILLHAHLMGREIKARHFRGDIELPPLAIEQNYDFNYQEYRYYEEEVSILPGDQITVECTYDSMKRKNVSFGGLSTKEEMCLAFVLYYPRIDRYASLSAPPLSTINEVLSTSFDSVWELYQLMQYDWGKINVKDVEKRFRFGEHSSLCYFGNGEKDAIKSLVSYPDNLQAFAPPASVCQKGDIVSDENCPEPNGMFPDPKNCSSFYHCDDGVAYHKACSPPLMFNPEKNTCDWPDNVKCGKH